MFDMFLTIASDLFFVIFEWLKSVDWTEILSFLSSVGVMIGIFLGLKSLSQQKKDLSSNVNWKSRVKALDYSRSTSKDYEEKLNVLETVFEQYYHDIKDDLDNNRTTVIPIEIIKAANVDSQIKVVLAHWENLALAIDVSVADEETAKAMTRTNVINTMTLYSEFIREEKKAARGKYDHLIRLATNWSISKTTKKRNKNPLIGCVSVLPLDSKKLRSEYIPKTALVDEMFRHVPGSAKYPKS